MRMKNERETAGYYFMQKRWSKHGFLVRLSPDKILQIITGESS
jgi:hypothetical protein